MTLVESLKAAAQGLPLSTKPILDLNERQAEFRTVLNPFGRAEAKAEDLNALLHDEPVQGNARLDHYIEQARGEIHSALVEAVECVVYILEGARSACCSPMEYGGYYLERDRELLTMLHGRVLTVLAIVGDEDVFLDFVSDLPADVFAWHAASGFDSAYVRGIRNGAQASTDPASEIELVWMGGNRDSGLGIRDSGFNRKGDKSPNEPEQIQTNPNMPRLLTHSRSSTGGSYV